jgi:RNA polymerase-interacting CarD/CdnL/TRCF family regulator
MSSEPGSLTLQPALDLSLGAAVVYGPHGIGRVSSRKTKGQRTETVVLEFPSGLAIMLPLERAEACLRPVAGACDLDDVRSALRTRNVPIEKSWQIRARATRAKIADGRPVGLAEIIRDAAERKRQSAAGATLSPAEQELYQKARSLLTAELSVVAQLDEAETDAWIDDQLDWNGE